MKALIAALVVSVVMIQGALTWLDQNITKRKHVFVPPPKYIKHLHFGYAETMADSLWLRAIQDFDYCESPEKSVVRDEQEILSEAVKSKKQQLEGEFSHVLEVITSLNKDVKVCKNGWLAQMLDGVTELAPKFKTAYLTGATSLSVIINDFEGATHLFNKGVKQFPDDWRLPYNAAYHFMYDRQDLETAARLLKDAADKGAPSWVNSLAARAFTASGQGELAIRTLLEFRKSTKGDLTKQVDERIRRIQEALLKEKQNGGG